MYCIKFIIYTKLVITIIKLVVNLEAASGILLHMLLRYLLTFGEIFTSIFCVEINRELKLLYWFLHVVPSVLDMKWTQKMGFFFILSALFLQARVGPPIFLPSLHPQSFWACSKSNCEQRLIACLFIYVHPFFDRH
jgi:hypothetical protein